MKVTLVDTDILIDVERKRAQLPRAALFISEITLYEFIRGRADYIKAKERLEEVFTVVPLSNEVLLKATEIYRELRKRGELMDERDLLIGATAITLNLPLLTGNRSHFEKLRRYGLKLL